MVKGFLLGTVGVRYTTSRAGGEAPYAPAVDVFPREARLYVEPTATPTCFFRQLKD